MSRQLTCAIAILFSAITLAHAAEPNTPRLPDPDPARLARLRDLKPNEGITLGKAAVIGEFNDTARKFELDKTGPQSRDYSIKMVWAPERNRAIFCGANHAVPHRLNDVWEFDLPSLSWNLLYAPDNARDYTGLGKDPSDVEFKDGIFITKRGGPGIIGHTWWGITYDPKLKALLFMNTWVTEKKKAAALLGGDPANLDPGPPLWAFYPETRKWEFIKTTPPAPTAPFGGMLEYIPELGGSIWHVNNWQMHETWLFDSATRKWKALKPNGGGKEFEQQSPQPEQVGYFDPKRKLVIVQRQTSTFHYDIAANQWKKVLEREKESTEVPHAHDSYSPLYHHPASGHGLLLDYKTSTLWAYDPDAVKWTKLAPTGDAMPDGSKRLVYIDPVQDVLVVIKGTTIWAYRYRAP